MDAIERFCTQLSEHYKEHHLSPSLVISRVNGTQCYMSVHTFPNGFASRTIVAKATHDTFDGCLAQLVESWLFIASGAK